MKILKYSHAYQQAIATLAQEFYDYGMKEKFKEIDWDDPWMELCQIPDLVEHCYRVEEKLDYELSWNQCCIAVAWAVKLEPNEWRNLSTNE